MKRKEAFIETNLTLDSNDNILVIPKEAAALLKVPTACLQKWRCTGEQDLPYIKLGRLIRYRMQDLKAFVNRMEVKQTNERS